ncbi:T9SS type A sorting domain-containing protein [Dyadobacter sp. NIV53]|uniref:T9SS type A sorting domain-containing protein n=1 Tax=Dyadobacter sp. NIV53 TaxID=2861765 RepID=UPI001C87A119|nr:T9SS type A sorting domain-containing protein [Dyadobacter sp. NIV53]
MQITLMPNPTSDFVTLKFSAAGPRKVSIYSMDGKLWLNKSMMLSVEKIDLSAFPSGIFIVQIDSGNYKKSFKIIRQ